MLGQNELLRVEGREFEWESWESLITGDDELDVSWVASQGVESIAVLNVAGVVIETFKYLFAWHSYSGALEACGSWMSQK